MQRKQSGARHCVDDVPAVIWSVQRTDLSARQQLEIGHTIGVPGSQQAGFEGAEDRGFFRMTPLDDGGPTAL